MNLYVTLDSTASGEIFNNVHADFTNKLAKPILLPEDTVVGLVEFTYFEKIKINLGEVKFQAIDSEEIYSVKIDCYEGQHVENFNEYFSG